MRHCADAKGSSLYIPAALSLYMTCATHTATERTHPTSAGMHPTSAGMLTSAAFTTASGQDVRVVLTRHAVTKAHKWQQGSERPHRSLSRSDRLDSARVDDAQKQHGQVESTQDVAHTLDGVPACALPFSLSHSQCSFHCSSKADARMSEQSKNSSEGTGLACWIWEHTSCGHSSIG